MTARIGLFDWLEGRIGTDGFLIQTDGEAHATGMGNVQIGAKLRLWANPGGVPVLSIQPTVNLPTASAEKGLGFGDADYALTVLTGTDIGVRGHVDVNYGIGSIGAGGGRPHFVAHLVSVSASIAATTRWDPYFEGYWISRQDAEGGAMTAIDTGAIYTVSPRLAFDGGVQFGVSRAAPEHRSVWRHLIRCWPQRPRAAAQGTGAGPKSPEPASLTGNPRRAACRPTMDPRTTLQCRRSPSG